MKQSVFCKWKYRYTEGKFEDTQGIIRNRKSKDRQHNDHKKMSKRTNKKLENEQKDKQEIRKY
jgi:hypothetical protein